MTEAEEFEICANAPLPTDTIAQRVDSLRFLLSDLNNLVNASEAVHDLYLEAARAIISSIQAKKAEIEECKRR